MDSITILRTESGKGLWVQGDTREHKEKLMELGGKWNSSKKAWVFSLKKQQELLDYFKLSPNEIFTEQSQQVLKAETKVEVETVTQPTKLVNHVEILKTKSGRGLWVQGDTREHKGKLMELGGKWNSSKKAWVFSLKKQQELLDLFGMTANEIGQEE